MKTRINKLGKLALCFLAGVGLLAAVGVILVATDGSPKSKEVTVGAYVKEINVHIQAMTRSIHRYSDLMRDPELTGDWSSRVNDEFSLWREDLEWWQDTTPPSSFQRFHDLQTEAAKERCLASEAILKGIYEATSSYVDSRLVSEYISLGTHHLEKAIMKTKASTVELKRIRETLFVP